MAVWTRAQLIANGGDVTGLASVKAAFGSPSTYTQILALLDEFHNSATELKRKIELVAEVDRLVNHWLEVHTGSSQADKKRRGALQTLGEQLLTVNWKEVALTDLKTALAGYQYSSEAKSTGVVFREEGPFMKKLKVYLELTGSRYVRDVLLPVVTEAAKKPGITGATAASNKEFLAGAYGLLATQLEEIPVPTDLAECARIVADAAMKGTGKPVSGYNALVNCMVLRLLNPALVVPDVPPHSIVAPSNGSARDRKTLMLLSKMFQCAANRSTMRSEEGATLNPIITTYTPSMVEFLVNNVYKLRGRGTSSAMDDLLDAGS